MKRRGAMTTPTKALLCAVLVAPLGAAAAPPVAGSGVDQRSPTACISPWDLIDPILWGSSVADAYVGPGLLPAGCSDIHQVSRSRDPVVYRSAVQMAASALGVYVAPLAWGPTAG
jgi:hypothetical protein